MTQARHKVAIIGASGYTGAELIRLILAHPSFEIGALAANAKAGLSIGEVFPQFAHLDLPPLVKPEEIPFHDIALAFCAVPHGTSHELVAAIPDSVKVVDLSAGFRLRDTAAYEKWYGAPHAAPALQQTAIYGLTEFYRDDIRIARLVAGTGCNSAACQYAVIPALRAGVLDPDDIIFDLKVGYSGAGRSLREALLYAEGADGVAPYALGSTHRHLAELDQELTRVAGQPVEVSFQPHLVPASRGVLVTAWLRGEAEAIYAAMAAAYRDEPFVHLLPMGQAPRTQSTRASNHAFVSVTPDRRTGRAVVTVALDNLTKGSSGQALQNANLMMGLKEDIGLTAPGLFP